MLRTFTAALFTIFSLGTASAHELAAPVGCASEVDVHVALALWENADVRSYLEQSHADTSLDALYLACRSAQGEVRGYMSADMHATLQVLEDTLGANPAGVFTALVTRLQR